MVQEQWLQLKMMFFLGYFLGLTFGGKWIKIWCRGVCVWGGGGGFFQMRGGWTNFWLVGGNSPAPIAPVGKTLHFFRHETILTFSESYWQTILHTFPELTSNNADISQRVTGKQYYPLFHSPYQTILIFSELLANNTAYISRAYIKQYWHFQRVIGKQYKLFQILYHYQTILTFSERLSESC